MSRAAHPRESIRRQSAAQSPSRGRRARSPSDAMHRPHLLPRLHLLPRPSRTPRGTARIVPSRVSPRPRRRSPGRGGRRPSRRPRARRPARRRRSRPWARSAASRAGRPRCAAGGPGRLAAPAQRGAHAGIVHGDRRLGRGQPGCEVASTAAERHGCDGPRVGARDGCG